MSRMLLGTWLITLSGIAAAYAVPCATATCALRAPEFHPASAVTAFTFLLGAVMALRGRSSSKS